ncbi:MAG: glycosyltransferase family 2 protein [Armatimonadota bacterium]|nr:glycosyltransferase family 2 protein [Armatimonadota bacterium]
MGTSAEPEVSVVIPCLNESETLETCIRKAVSCLEKHGLSGEVVVADNGSSDGSQEIAVKAGARVVHVEEKGYGNALRGGIEAARGRYVIMGDADDSYDFSSFYPFIEELRKGADLVMGNRFRGGIMPGAMPWKNHYIGNPIQTKIGQIMFRCPIGDFNCGLRGFTKEAYGDMGLVTTTWEFASEMVIKASLKRMNVVEVPIILHKDGRSHPPHLQPWRAGWRNIRFMLLHSPRWLFLIPGLILLFLGALGFGLVLPGPFSIGVAAFDVTTLVISSLACILAFQVVAFGVLARAFGAAQGLLPPDKKIAWFRRWFSLEIALLGGITLILLGAVLLVAMFVSWYKSGFGPLEYEQAMRLAIPAVTLVALGVQIGFISFFISVLDLRTK